MSVAARLFGPFGRRGWAAVLLALSVLGVASRVGTPAAEDARTLDARYEAPLPPPRGPMRVFHLGHSLVGRDMPAMLQQLAGAGHRHESQLGWGTSLKAHWGPADAIAGFDAENAHDRFRPAKEALQSGAYDAVVLTEMVELRDAIAYHQSGLYLGRWAGLAQGANPAARVFLYETWHRLDDPEGWLARLDADPDRYWEGRLLAEAMVAGAVRPVHVIPAGQVLARFVRAVEAGGGGPAARRREDLFARDPDGNVDPIHLNDIGAYLVALTHFAVLYQTSPHGLPHRLRRADGSAADAPDAETALLMQRIVWQVVTTYPKTGVPQESSS